MSDNSSYVQFIEIWSLIMVYGAAALIFIAMAVVIIHHIKISSIKEYKRKYEYINKNEIRWYTFTYILIGIAVAFISNTYSNETVLLNYA